MLFYFCVLYFIASDLAMMALIWDIFGDNSDDYKTYFARLVIITVALGIDIVWLVTTLMLFTYAAYTKHRAAFMDYRLKLVLQVIGTVTTLGINAHQ